MTHFTEDGHRLVITIHHAQDAKQFQSLVVRFNDVVFLRLPTSDAHPLRAPLANVGKVVHDIVRYLGSQATVVVVGEVVDLVNVHTELSNWLTYHLWISIKRSPVLNASNDEALQNQHIGALVYTRYKGSLEHVKTRQHYTRCPACGRTTKDYGGKKHTYHAEGTLISDVWRDVEVEPNGDITPVLERFADLFGVPNYHELRVLDLSHVLTERVAYTMPYLNVDDLSQDLASQLLHGDVIEQLRTLPSNSIDFAFADPPYNLKKSYQGYGDDLHIQQYFQWCDAWIDEVARVLRPGGTFALLNIPLWAIRHFVHLQSALVYQNWIVWDALSFPVRLIMPAHYTILCFSKGESRPLPGLASPPITTAVLGNMPIVNSLDPLEEGYCLRSSCVNKRIQSGHNDRGNLSDIWWDIHRLKHNTRRVDHPCQLPPQLLQRLILLYTEPDEMILDCFNGAGTTTLVAHQLGRRYIGIELEQQYHELEVARHEEIAQGLDPFRKAERVLTAKNSPVERVKKQRYEVPKKTLQLEVRRVAQLLGHLPSRDEMIEHGEYPIRYYDDYFASWGEVCAAARNSGMDDRPNGQSKSSYSQRRLF